MKKIIICLLIFTSTNLFSQVEMKTNPVALLFEIGLLSLEYNNQKDWGGEIDLGFGQDFFVAYVTGKHYFNPKRGADKFNVGVFAGGFSADGDSGGGLGFFAGYKAVSEKNILLEIAYGIGRDFGDSGIGILPYAKFHLGYRFQK